MLMHTFSLDLNLVINNFENIIYCLIYLTTADFKYVSATTLIAVKLVYVDLNCCYTSVSMETWRIMGR